MKKLMISLCLVGGLSLVLMGCDKNNTPQKTNERHDDHSIKVGAIIELTGTIPAVGASSKNAAELAVKEINAKGGIVVDHQKRLIQLIIADNGGLADQSATAAQKLINQDQVIAIVGPNASLGAIPAADIAEAAKTVLIAPWSTNPKTTLNLKTQQPKQYVFRACFTDPFEGSVLANFAYNTQQYKTAAVLYDISSEAPTSQANLFKQAFEKLGGRIVAFETYGSNDKDFSAQLTKIKASNPAVLFLPAYYNDVPLIAQQAHQLGMNVPLLGSDAWSSPDLIKLARGSVDNAYFANHYSPVAPNAVTRQFVVDYTQAYGHPPDDVAALTYDAYQILFRALAYSGSLNRDTLRDSIADLPVFTGVTGHIKFTSESGDPVKSAVIMQIRNNQFVWVANINP